MGSQRTARKKGTVKDKLDRLLAKRSSLEMEYDRTDTKRLKEFKSGGITQETAIEHIKVCEELEKVYYEIEEARGE